jgi:hypothetical protein
MEERKQLRHSPSCVKCQETENKNVAEQMTAAGLITLQSVQHEGDDGALQVPDFRYQLAAKLGRQPFHIFVREKICVIPAWQSPVAPEIRIPTHSGNDEKWEKWEKWGCSRLKLHPEDLRAF